MNGPFKDITNKLSLNCYFNHFEFQVRFYARYLQAFKTILPGYYLEERDTLNFLSTNLLTQLVTTQFTSLPITPWYITHECFLLKTWGLRPEACNFLKKETPAQVFSYEFCEIFKNTFFYRTPPVAASKFLLSG